MTLFTAYISQRTRLAGRGVLDLLTWIPVTVLAVALIWAYVGLVRLPFPFYGTIWILIIAVTITTITTGARTMNGSMVQISPELEEAARMQLQYELWSGGQPEVAAALGTLNMLFSIVLVMGDSLLLKRVTAR